MGLKRSLNFELWSNPFYLYDYFEKNQIYLRNKFWRAISIEDADRITKQRHLILKSY